MPIGQYVFSRVEAGLTQTEARELAADLGGQLASVTSQEEHEFLLEVLERDQALWGGEPRDTARNGFWIGLSQPPGSPEPGGGWVWDSGEAFDFTAWHAGQPDNFLGDATALYWDNDGQIGWADHVDDPVSAGFGAVVSTAVEFAGGVKALGGTSGHDFVWGGPVANTVRAGGGRDIVEGNGGADRLFGGTGADQLFGGAGGDRITGGAGGDRIEGGDGADTFIYLGASDSGLAPKARDVISGFDAAAGDRIDLTAFDAVPGGTHDPLVFRAGGFSGTGQVRAHISGDNTFVDVNLSGDRTPELRIVLEGHHDLDQGAFVL